MSRVRLGRGAVALGLAVLVAAGILGLVTVVGFAGPRTVAGTTGSPRDAVALPPQLGTLPSSTDPSAGPLPQVAPPVPGTRLRIPRLGVDTPVVPVRARNAVMQVPRDPRVVGWWRGGAVPGASRGSAVLVGHVNYDGAPGALGTLPRARPGDEVTLSSGVRFRVSAVRVYPKTTGLPVAAFAESGPPQLVLITCGGPFDPVTGNYEDNIAVFAHRGT